MERRRRQHGALGGVKRDPDSPWVRQTATTSAGTEQVESGKHRRAVWFCLACGAAALRPRFAWPRRGQLGGPSLFPRVWGPNIVSLPRGCIALQCSHAYAPTTTHTQQPLPTRFLPQTPCYRTAALDSGVVSNLRVSSGPTGSRSSRD